MLLLRTLCVLSALLVSSAAPAPQPHSGVRTCHKNMECIQRGFPLLPPAPKRSPSLHSRASPLPPTPSDFAYTGAVDYFHPQTDGYYTITALGASGGRADTGGGCGVGGLAARTEATVYLTTGQSLSVVVGGMGSTSIYGDDHGGGGGGGSLCSPRLLPLIR